MNEHDMTIVREFLREQEQRLKEVLAEVKGVLNGLGLAADLMRPDPDVPVEGLLGDLMTAQTYHQQMAETLGRAVQRVKFIEERIAFYKRELAKMEEELEQVRREI